ncbi:Uncharacterized protein AMR50_4389, partial [Leptospira interrogans]
GYDREHSAGFLASIAFAWVLSNLFETALCGKHLDTLFYRDQ